MIKLDEHAGKAFPVECQEARAQECHCVPDVGGGEQGTWIIVRDKNGSPPEEDATGGCV